MDSSRSDGLDKLLPKKIKEKRRLRKQRRSGAPGSLRTTSSQGADDSDDTGSFSNMGGGDDDDDDRSLRDNGSFRSFNSGQESAQAKETPAISTLGTTSRHSVSPRNSEAEERAASAQSQYVDDISLSYHGSPTCTQKR